MKIITVSGLDGSGKSTQIDLLRNYLGEQGKRVRYFHAINFSFGNKFLKGERSESGSRKSTTSASWLQIQLRKLGLCIDLCRFKLLLFGMRRKGYDFLVSDRYFYDTVINIQYLSGKRKKLCAERFIRQPDVAMYLKTDPEAIMNRDRVPDQGLEYLKAKQKLFGKNIERWKMKLVDGNRRKEEVFNEIKGIVEEK